jgi:hypothetical protein
MKTAESEAKVAALVASLRKEAQNIEGVGREMADTFAVGWLGSLIATVLDQCPELARSVEFHTHWYEAQK